MIRKNFMMTNRQAEMLSKEAKRLEVSMSEVLRKALDSFFSNKDKKND